MCVCVCHGLRLSSSNYPHKVRQQSWYIEDGRVCCDNHFFGTQSTIDVCVNDNSQILDSDI